MGFSSIFKRARNVLLLPLTLVIFSFLVIMMFKPMLLYTENNWYEKYLLYNFDIGYHFANTFTWIGEFFNPDILDYPVAYDFLHQYVIDVQDPNLDTDTFCNYYYPDYLQEHCWAMRETILITETHVDLVNFYFDDYMYMYRATLLYLDPTTGSEKYIDYNVSYWYDADGSLRLIKWDRK